MIVVLLLAAGAGWESAALRTLDADRGSVVLKRCVDVDDLLATAATGQAQVAVVALDAPGLDPSAVDLLRRHAVAPVVVLPAGAAGSAAEAATLRATRLGVDVVVDAGAVTTDAGLLPAAVARAAAGPAETTRPRPQDGPADLDDDPAADGPRPDPGRVLAVWGPAGSPGRSTLAAAVAAELGRRQRRTILVDADPVAPSLAQQLGVTDEVSGLLAAGRLATTGRLHDDLAGVQRALDRSLSLVTGLPRPDRWPEVRAGVVEALLVALRERGEVVVDVGPSLEQDPADVGPRPGRNQATLEALAEADHVLVVGAADPVGLARLARGLAALRDLVGVAPVHVVVNRMRPTLGWSERDVAAMVGGFGPAASLHFLPDDQPAADRALVTGRTLVEVGDGPLVRAVAAVVDDLGRAGEPAAAGPRRVRPRRAGRARRR